MTLGSFHFDPYNPAIDADPFPYYRHLRDEHPCFWSEEAQMWILSRYSDIVSAGQDWQTYSSASGNLMTELTPRRIDELCEDGTISGGMIWISSINPLPPPRTTCLTSAQSALIARRGPEPMCALSRYPPKEGLWCESSQP